MRVAMAVVVGAACALTSGGRELPTAPPPRAKPTNEDWLPKADSEPRFVEKRFVLAPNPPSAFPDIVNSVIPAKTPEDLEKNWTNFEKRCPKLFGTVVLKIEPTDDTFQKLLKARLHQGVLEFQHYQRILRGQSIAGPGPDTVRYRICLLDMQSAAAELWTGQQEFVLWLEELLVAAKEFERYTRSRASIGTTSPGELHAASRLRLKMEAELWKAKNAK